MARVRWFRRVSHALLRQLGRLRRASGRNKDLLPVAAVIIAVASLGVSTAGFAWNVWSGMSARPTLRVEQTDALPSGGLEVELENFSVGTALLLTNPTTNPLTVTDFVMLHEPVVEDGVRTLHFGGWTGVTSDLPARLEAGGATILPIRFTFRHDGATQAFAKLYRPKLRLMFNTTAGPVEGAIYLHLSGQSLKWLDDQSKMCLPYRENREDWRACLREPPPNMIKFLERFGSSPRKPLQDD